MSRDRATYLKFKPMADDLRKAESWSEPDGVLNRNKTMQNLYKIGYRKQEWISVEERLPEKSGDYLTYHEHGSCGVIYYNADITLWNVYFSDDVRNAIRSITHWMPLPEAPKMKGESDEKDI